MPNQNAPQGCLEQPEQPSRPMRRHKQSRSQSNNNGQSDVDKETRLSSRESLQNINPISHSSIEPNINTSTCYIWKANNYKNIGNKLCNLHRYEDAIVYYSKAISQNPEVSSYYSNRALCYLKLQKWIQTIEDCRRALDLDSNLIKPHFFLGQALAETGNLDDALRHLQKANELAKANKMNFGDDITYQIRLIKRRRWNKIEEDSEKLEDDLQEYLMGLIQNDKRTKLKSINEQLQTIDSKDDSNDSCKPRASSSIDVNTAQITTQQTNIESEYDIYTEKLKSIFQNLKLQRRRRDVPEYLCGKISFEIMHDPVITPSGITYDRKDIEEHLKRVGHFDPITRQPLKTSQLISNLAMKEVVDAYLKDNEWALYY